MFKKRKFDDDNIESECSIELNNSMISVDSESSSDILSPMRKRAKLPTINDEEEENTSRQLSEPWIWRETDNESNIWKYTEIPGIQATTLCHLGKNPSKLDVFLYNI